MISRKRGEIYNMRIFITGGSGLLGSKIVSTDYVFSGDKGMYKEEDVPKFGLDKDLIKPSRMEAMGLVAKRPEDSSLDTSKASRYLKEKPLGLDMALEILEDELKKKG